MVDLTSQLKFIAEQIEGDLFFDNTSRLLYSTDASVYKEKPLAVARPKSVDDIKKLIIFARRNKIGLIPRTAGTSLAGQVVGDGIVVDVSKYLTDIIELNSEEKWVRVQPGVILDELNMYLAKYDLFFGPETSTSNRCMIGGMVGNNACGAHSLIYGSTRDHLLELKVILSDGSEAIFGELSTKDFKDKLKGDSLENKIYKHLNDILSDKENQVEIKREFPDPKLERRNTGYAVEYLLDSDPFIHNGKSLNLCKLLAGSEGTLAFITEIKLNLVPVKKGVKGLICVHCNSLEEALEGNLIVLKHKPDAIELIDDVILECTKSNLEQQRNRFFVKGDPAAILIIEVLKESQEEVLKLKDDIEKEMTSKGYGYHFPVVFGEDMTRVWALRKAGLGVLSNIPGDGKPVSFIEDTAVLPEYLPEFVKEFKAIINKHKLDCVYHAHIATGELHLRPVLNLKEKKDVQLFREIGFEVARLVKKYKGSFSGEHGDGRVRGEMIPVVIGDKNYALLKEIKHTWDPENIFNKGKIVDTPPMDTSLRYEPGTLTREIETIFDFSSTEGIIRMAEKCNGSGDCRKTALIGGTMCPSYMATRDENTTTRARANILREFLTHSTKKNPFDHKEIYQVLDLCLSCKGCKSECPSNVDMAKLKAEFLQHYYDAHGIPLRTRLIAYISSINKMGSLMPSVFNWFMTNKIISSMIKGVVGFAQKRSIPVLHKFTMRRWIKNNLEKLNRNIKSPKGTVNLFIDEFTNYNDVQIGITTIKLLTGLSYNVNTPKHTLSGRTFLSKGLLRSAKKIAQNNIEMLFPCVLPEKPLLGIEPSAILSFRDEYPDLAGNELKEKAIQLSKNAFTIDEFLAMEFEKGNIETDLFTKDTQKIKLHGHCQQKSIASTKPTISMLSIPENYSVEEIKSGCCGMAGSFGYEQEHYNLSMKVGELVLFPEVRKAADEVIISASGTSCRHQIKDGTGKIALHPVEVLYQALLR